MARNGETPELLEVLREALAAWGPGPALIDVSGPGAPTMISAAQLAAEVAALAEQLPRWGVRPRRPAALLLENSADFVLLFLALLQVGAVPVPLKLEYRELELQEIFANCDPPVVFAEERHLPVLGARLASRHLIIRRGGRWRLAQTGAVRRAEPELAEDVASVNYTYRGHGFPLGALVPYGQYLLGAQALQEGLLASSGERMLVLLPMSHIFTLVGCLFVPLLVGVTAVILRSFHPRLIFETLSGQEVQYLTAVPEILQLLARLRRGAGPLPALKAFVSGGSLLSAASYREIRRAFGAELMHGYGLTELAPVSRNIRGRSRGGTVGPVCRGVRCRIAGGLGGEPGEIQVRCPAMFRGYLGRPEETSSCREGAWFRTGDLGRFDGDHLVFVRERKDTCKVNGAMVDLAEVRRAVVSLPGVRDAEIVYQGGTLRARVEGPRWDAEERVEARRRLGQLLAAYKIPRVIA